MFEYSDNGVTVAAVLDTRRENKEGLFPVRIRVTYKRDRKYYPTGQNLSIAEWDRMPATKNRLLNEIKNRIQVTADKVKDPIKDLIKNDLFSLDALNKRLSNVTSDTVNISFQARIENLKSKGKLNTAEWYRNSITSIKLFAGNNIKFSQITIDWLRRYEKQLLVEKKSYTTISMYMRALLAIVNEAKRAGVIKPSQHPFGKGRYEIPRHQGRSIALPISAIGKLVKYECETPAIELYRDLWFFSYLCNGANITDICKFRFSNIRNGEISFYRQKTLSSSKVKKAIHAVITPEMKNIIGRWGNKSINQEDFIFPFLKGNETPDDERRIIRNLTNQINIKMKVLGERLEIGTISTYTARHSYASVLKRSGANIAFISESLGHTDLKTTENYLASFEQEERVKNAALLTNF